MENPFLYGSDIRALFREHAHIQFQKIILNSF